MIDKNTASWKISLFVIVALIILLSLILFVFFLRVGWDANTLRDSKKTLAKPTVVYPDPLITSAGPTVPPIEPVDPVLGTDNAELTIVYFSDFACPYCKRMTEVWFRVIDEYGDRVNLVWKDLLSTPNSLPLHKAARCAQLQDSFWEYNKKLLLHQPDGGSLVNQLTGYAAELGLNSASFVECMADVTIEGVVFASTDQAINSGLSSTPAFFIGNDYYEGFVSYDDIKSIIEEKLGLNTEEEGE